MNIDVRLMSILHYTCKNKNSNIKFVNSMHGYDQQNIRAKFDEAEGRGGLPFTSYDYVHHLVSGQSLGLELWLE